MLRLSGVAVQYGHVEALRGVDLEVRPGEIVAVIGANGAGKTTLLNAISGLTPLAAGRIELDGRRIDGLAAPRIVHLGIS
ncbi:MAG TPA: ATP-binding cassette domain-containing protein, partial [Chloroflexota bacterium]